MKHNDGTVGIAAYAGLEEEISIPEEIEGMTVTTIENKAFYDNQNIGVVHIPETVNTIGYMAFAGSGITSIEIPETVTSWGQSDWNYHLPSGARSDYTNAAFAECENLENVIIK